MAVGRSLGAWLLGPSGLMEPGSRGCGGRGSSPWRGSDSRPPHLPGLPYSVLYSLGAPLPSVLSLPLPSPSGWSAGASLKYRGAFLGASPSGAPGCTLHGPLPSCSTLSHHVEVSCAGVCAASSGKLGGDLPARGQQGWWCLPYRLPRH